MTNISCKQDFGNTEYYKSQNKKLRSSLNNGSRIVFMGNSITENWKEMDTSFFSNSNYINRGISGQTTPQILRRFQSDVIDLHPAVVIILAGTNDIAQNTGPMRIQEISENIFSMAELAKKNAIKVIIASVLPAHDFHWNPEIQPIEKITKLNGILKKYAHKNELVYLDYYQAMVDEKKALQATYTYDGVHPNQAGYQVMAPLAIAAIEKALHKD